MSTTPWGGRLDKGTGSIETVIRDWPIGHHFTEDDVEREISRRGLPPRGAIGNHLHALAGPGYIQRTDTGWVRVR